MMACAPSDAPRLAYQTSRRRLVQGVGEGGGLGWARRPVRFAWVRGVAVPLGLGAWPSAKHLLEARVLALVLSRRGGRGGIEDVRGE